MITGVRIRPDRAELLKEKAMELTVKKKDYIKESDIVNFFIDSFTERLDVDEHGIYLIDEKD